MSMLPENHAYSYSQLQSVDECPYAFYLQRIEKLPQKSNAFAEQGTLIHDLIDLWAKGKLSVSQLPIEYKRRYPQEVVNQFPRMLAAKGYAEKTYQQGLLYMENFDGFAGYDVLDSELKFRTDIEGRPFVGVIDMVLRDQFNNELIILDHKSKSLSSFKKSENEMYRQQYLYSKFACEKYGRFPDRLMFNLFKEGGLLQEREFNNREFEDTQTWALAQIEKIERFDVMDWLQSKETSDFFCQELCSMRGECANGTLVPKYNKKERNYEAE